jgi:hypothetical protein
MPNKRPLMRLSPDEELFLRQWMYDEIHYQQGRGPAKQLQVEHRVIPADLATLIAAAIPDPGDQAAIGNGPPPAGPLPWPWESDDAFHTRVAEARHALTSGRMTRN